jgi:hypothetical protein
MTRRVTIGTKCELWGMSIILIAATFQLFLLDAVVEGVVDGSFYRVEEKLDSIWALLADLYTQSGANRSEATSLANFPVLLKNWKEWNEGMEHIKSQRETFSYVAAGVFVFGSVLTILGKYLDAKRS